ncbi:MAG: MFS transporter, partial [Pseudomonadota bacterium]|nr:MFS transporter [Pseudomonadota bacterium]
MPERSSETKGGRVGSQSDKAQEQTHVAALAATKLADGLIDPKLVLAWLLNAIGAPGFLIGILVPVREAGSLLPQLALARH